MIVLKGLLIVGVCLAGVAAIIGLVALAVWGIMTILDVLDGG